MDAGSQKFDIAEYTKSWKEVLGELKNSRNQFAKPGVSSVIDNILNSAKNTSSLSGCLSCIKSVAKYLSHESEIVRNIAATVLISLIVKAVELLSKETDPNVIKNTAKDLLEVIEQISDLKNNGSISLGKGAQNELSSAKAAITEKLKEANEANKDRFVSFEEKSQNGLPKEFTDQFEKAKDNLTGGISSKEFKDKLRTVTDSLIGLQKQI